MVESPPADAGDAGSCPGPGRSHMPRSGWAREPWLLSLRVRGLCSAAGEATTVRGLCTAKQTNKQKKPYSTLKVQWLGLQASTAGGLGSIPGWELKSHRPRSGWARESRPLSLRVRSLCSATGEATTVRGPRTAKSKKTKQTIQGQRCYQMEARPQQLPFWH